MSCTACSTAACHSLPNRAFEGGSPVREGDSARTVNDRAETFGIECAGHVAGGCPLGAEAGNQQWHPGQRSRNSVSCSG